uniref:Granulins domain-containing protein n=1 Tax=Oryza glumipatula TaxID=40148 RepID=A0A0D9YU11_9ORYZ
MAPMTSKIAGALTLVLLLVLTAVTEGQVLPTPCCRIDCCDGKPECCDPGFAATVVTMAVTTPAAAVTTSKARPAATTAGTTMAPGAAADVLLSRPQSGVCKRDLAQGEAETNFSW